MHKIKCPNCEKSEHLWVEVMLPALAKLNPDGTTTEEVIDVDSTNIVYGRYASVYCMNCRYFSKVHECRDAA